MARVPAAERRQKFVLAAVAVIAAHGVDGATTRKITEEAQAPLATLHYCFHTKEELFGAVYEELSRVLCDEVLAAGEWSGSVAGTAVDLLRRIMLWYSAESDFAAAAIELILWARRQQGDIAIQAYDDVFAVIRTRLREAGGGVVSDVVLERVPPMIAAFTDGFVLNWLTYDEKDRHPAHIDSAADALEAYFVAAGEI